MNVITGVSEAAQISIVSIIIFLLGMIKIPKIEINLWGCLANFIGKALNREVIKKVDDIAQELKNHIEQEAEEKASSARRSFLVFNEELYANKHHTREHFEEILRNIDDYEDYCADHPLYENNKAELAIENIKRVYKQCVKDHSFLGPEN